MHIVDSEFKETDFELIEKLLNLYSDSKAQNGKFDSVYFNTLWDEFIERSKPYYLKILKNRDVEELAKELSNFSRTSTSAGFSESFSNYTDDMYYMICDDIKNSIYSIANHVDYDLSIDSLEISMYGNQFGITVNEKILNFTTLSNLTRANLTNTLFKDSDGRKIVAELGGGRGGYAYCLFKQNSNTTYIDFDLPETLIVEAYYLSKTFPEKKTLMYNPDIHELNIDFLLQYDMVFMPNFMITALESNSVDFFINTISIGEMNIDSIEEYFKQIDRTTKYYLYLENLVDRHYASPNFSMDLYNVPLSFQLLSSTEPLERFFNFHNGTHNFCNKLYIKKDKLIIL